MLREPAVTVIVPAYNAADTLGRCLDSVVGQDLGGMEIIVVDDGSTDETSAVARKYPQISLVRQERCGVAVARWLGIRESRGEYIGFVDADDFIAPDMMRSMYEAAAGSGADIAVCGSNKVWNGVVFPHNLYGASEPESGIDAVTRIILRKGEQSLWNKIFRRSLFREEDLERTRGIRHGEDQLLAALTIRFARKVVYLPQVFYYYVQTPGSICHNPTFESARDSFNAKRFLYRFFLSSEVEAWRKHAAAFFVRAALPPMRIVNRARGCPERKAVMADMARTMKEIPVSRASGAGLRARLDFLLVKTGLFYALYSLWECPLFAPLRLLARRTRFLAAARSGRRWAKGSVTPRGGETPPSRSQS